MDKKILDQFGNIFEELGDLHGASYFTVFKKSNDGSILNSYNSNKYWEKLYFSDKLSIHCPLMKLGRHLKPERISQHIINWDNVKASTMDELNVVEARADFNINSGYSFLDTFNGDKSVVTIAFKDKNIHHSKLQGIYDRIKIINSLK